MPSSSWTKRVSETPAIQRRAHGGPVGTAWLRSTPEDFHVAEQLGFQPAGEGVHAYLHVRKRGANTAWVARQLARCAGVRERDVGYAGLKDRHAVTEQWFSVDLSGRDEPDWEAAGIEGVEIVATTRHARKLKRGALSGNVFHIALRGVEAGQGVVESRLQAVAEQGVPNYFGAQRFGRGGGNLEAVRAHFAGERVVRDRHRRGLLLSAARSELFNRVLAARVEDDTWSVILPGDVMMLAGTRSVFGPVQPDAELEERLRAGDIHPTGPLWGRGRLPVEQAAAELEVRVLADAACYREGLEHAGLAQERRSLRLLVEELDWSWPAADRLDVSFRLPAGAYATTVLAEVLECHEPEMEKRPHA